MLKENKKALFVYISLVILIVTNFVAIESSATFNKYNEEGIWIDSFNDLNDVENISSTLELKNGKIVLKQGNPIIVYNHKNYPNNVKAWTQSTGIFGFPSIEALARLIKPDSLPGEKVSEENISNIDELDDKVIKTSSLWMSGVFVEYPFLPIHHFQFKVNQKIDSIENVTVKWWFGKYRVDAYLKEINLYVWNYGIGAWAERDSITYSAENISYEELHPDLYSSLPKSYISKEGYVDILIVGIPKEDLNPYEEEQSTLYTDFVEIEVVSKYGYYLEGNVTSKEISPPDLAGWEYIFWEGSRSSERIEIVVQVLNKNDKVLIEGKTSPLDISSIREETIKLRALLKSSSIDFTPYLDSWGVIWHKNSGYTDKFTTSYKLDEIEGIKINYNNVTVNKFQINWEIFGREPANTRFYPGASLSTAPTSFYWRSKIGYGGGFRQVVSGNGKIYVPASDNRIYSFNVVKDSSDSIQFPVDFSEAKYVVESCIGLSEDYLIIGTCGANNTNGLYGLSTIDLSELWNLSFDNESIYFFSPPTIHEDKVFVTSSGTMAWNLLFSLLSKFVEFNNMLFALDLKTGSYLWDPVALPAPSISSPAVGDGKLFVGCQNLLPNGSSLFAYDIDTGEEIWNVSVGAIGRASPVYANGKVFVLSTQRETLTSKGINQVVAIDAETGEKLWNVSIGESSLTFTDILKGIKTPIDNAPMSSPAYYNGVLYILSPDGKLIAINSDNGEEIWSYELSKDAKSYYITSPITTTNYVYVVNGNAKIYAFDIKSSNKSVEPLWTYQIYKPQYVGTVTPDLIASPIIVNGLIILSCTEDTVNMSGRIYCLGEYSPDYKGKVVSKAIHLPYGYWWGKLNAEFNQTGNNTIKFYVLYDDKELSVNGTNSDLSKIKSRVIKLKAIFNIKNTNESSPILKEWSVSWVKENAKPVFIENSFKPGYENWINDVKPTFSIDVEDKGVEGVISGLDISSAKFMIKYNYSNQTNSSTWYSATTSSNESGVVRTTIYADVKGTNLSIDEIVEITFKISDLAGNEATFTKSKFKFDFDKPSSRIIGNYSDKYNASFNISANASDDESGVYSVELRYRTRKSQKDTWSSWDTYGSYLTKPPYEWKFDTNKSGYYQVLSIAKDKAGNEEDIDLDKLIEFKFDKIPPVLENAEILTTPDTIPKVNLTVRDDLELYALYYSYDLSKWVKIEENIQNDRFSTVWVMEEEDWNKMITDEEKMLFFKIVDSCGNVYISRENESLSILKGKNASNYYLDLSDFNNWHWDNVFTIYVRFPSGFDARSVALYYKYSEDGETWSENYTIYGVKENETSYEWSITPPNGSGYYKFKAEIVDSSGRIYEITAEKISITLFPTMLFLALITVLIVLIIVVIFVVKRIKKTV